MKRHRLGVRPLFLLMPLLALKCSGDDYSVGGPDPGTGGSSGGTAGALGGTSGGFIGGRSDGSSGAASGAAAGSGEPGAAGDGVEAAGGQSGGSAGSNQGGGGATEGGRDDGGGGDPPGMGGGGTPSGSAGAPPCAHTVAASCLGYTQDPVEAAGSEAVATLEGVDQLNGINRHNQMVGSGVTDCGTVSALMYHEGEVHSLLAGLDHAYSRAVDINDRGIVVGEVTLGESPETRSFPFIWNNGVFEVLTELAGHAVLAINNRDQVLLRPPPVQVDAGLQPVGALWEAGVLTPLGSVPGARGLYVNDLNNVGQVVGNLYKVGGSNVGFLWENGTIREIPELSSATAINDGGLIAGSARTTTQQSPAIWDGENLRLFGGQNDSEPVWLGNDGSVLGPHYVYVDGVLSQLSINVRNSWTTIEAREMNDDGVIVGDIDAIVVRPGPGSCKLESCESSTLYATIWSPDCFGACCGDPQGGAGGGGGVGGMGEN